MKLMQDINLNFEMLRPEWGLVMIHNMVRRRMMENQIALIFTALLMLLTQTPAAHTSVPAAIKQQILNSKGDVNKIIQYMLTGDGRHKTFNRLAELGDTYGQRMSGTKALEDAIDHILETFKTENFDNPHEELVTVQKWIRGNEYATLVLPHREQNLPVLSLGGSIGTGGNYIEANIVVVKSLDELQALNNDQVAGKIVVLNTPWPGRYVSTVRSTGARRAAEKGAVAALIRSVTQFSIASPHTGHMQNASIPGACITVEDAEMLQRMFDRGWNVTVRLYMEARNEHAVQSRNVVAEIKGSDYPDSTVIFGGHIDTWDVGDGSMDDGGGVMIAWQALSAIKALGIVPRRTIRLVLWTAEEQGLIGGRKYFEDHKNEINNVSLIIESDNGAFKPRGIGFTGTEPATLIMQEILTTMVSDLNMTGILRGEGSQPDTGEWVSRGVPGVSLYSYNEQYFYFHHTQGDSMTVLNADDLDRGTILWATVALAVANLDENLPRVDSFTSGSPAIRCLSAMQLLVVSTVSTWFPIYFWKRFSFVCIT